jgi:hypothetical protein
VAGAPGRESALTNWRRAALRRMTGRD